MKVTKAKFRKYESGKLYGFADIVIDNKLKVNGLTVFKNESGVSFSMPSKKKGDSWYETVFCLEDSLRNEILSAIKEAIKKEGESPEPEDELDDLPF